ncbi:phosphoserine phosphatase SerB [Rubellimicrobium rubrum]|uniref:Phosphoserine phosphatase n=1 Tax=Rubellimicrobium rubrum TaxID=2585369 RepID=A0A5C4MW48_9RHOB|nr:phosphoserine phosphatase SerB [Rubellimicrobium rubrum]TNC48313.1 phosphoserine phosphatase SerB [Rubellimicrobium rubrum]
MQVVTLIAAPGGLPASLAEDLRAAWTGSAIRWLSQAEAAEFDIADEPADLWARWEALQAQDVDLLVQPAVNRRKRMLLADMDSTMIQQECIDELAAVAGVGERVAAITARAMNGEIGFEGALRERVGLLRDLPEAVIDQVLAERITYMPGGAALLSTMKAHGAHSVLVSGGFLGFARPVAAHLGFHEARANTLLAQDGHLTGEVAEPILGREAKVATLEEVTQRLGIGPQDVLAVGDGANDLGMLRLAGAGVALHAKPAVQEQCRLRVNHGDLTALLYLQGYARSEFA